MERTDSDTATRKGRKRMAKIYLGETLTDPTREAIYVDYARNDSTGRNRPAKKAKRAADDCSSIYKAGRKLASFLV